MAWITKPIDSYWFRIHAREGDPTAATIFCRDDNQTVAWLIFKYDLDGTHARVVGQNETIQLYYPASLLSTMLETLRSEGPLSVHMNANVGWGYVTSGVEPVGEEEAALLRE